MASEKKYLPTKIEELCVLIVGPSGSGKSEMINALSSYGTDCGRDTGLSATSITEKAVTKAVVIEVTNRGRRYLLKLYDTRGLSDSNASFTKLLPEWNELIIEELTLVHMVVFVLPPDRLSESLLHEVVLLTQALVSWGMRSENVMVVLNKCDFFKPEVLDSFEETLRRVRLPPVLTKSLRILRTSFLPRKLVIEAIAPLAENLMIDSTNRLMDALLCQDQLSPFKPQRVLVRRERRVLYYFIFWLLTVIGFSKASKEKIAKYQAHFLLYCGGYLFAMAKGWFP
jgi:energy-coupling factor transporter ATP-binding protein EcfA2